MITPDYLNEIVRASEDRLTKLHNDLIGEIADHVSSYFGKAKEPELRPTEINKVMIMRESGKVFEDIQAEIVKQYPEIENEVKQAFLNSAKEISDANTRFEQDLINTSQIDVEMPNYDVNGIPTTAKDLNLTDAEVRQLEADYSLTKGTMKNLSNTTANASQTAFINAVDNAIFKAQHGKSLDQAVIEAIDEMAARGIDVVWYGNRAENIEVAIARAVRTGINQANAHIVLQRCAETGMSYVLVSEHIGARVTDKDDYTNHSWWQGKVYKLNWDNPELAKYKNEAKQNVAKHTAEIAEIFGDDFKVEKEYPDFIETCGFGKVQGICGANCRHSFQSWSPEFQDDIEPQVDYEQSEKRYKEEQEARRHERNIRKTQREIIALENAQIESENATNKQQELRDKLKKQVKAYNDYCKEHHISGGGAELHVGRRGSKVEFKRVDVTKPLIKESNLLIEKTENSDIIKPKIKKDNSIMKESAKGDIFKELEKQDVVEFAHMNEKTLEVIKNNIGETNSKVILTKLQHEHIKTGNHPQDYPIFKEFGKDVIENPDLILLGQLPNTVLLLKALDDETRLNIVVKIALSKDELENSIITAYRVGLDETSRSFRKLIKRNVIIYKFDDLN